MADIVYRFLHGGALAISVRALAWLDLVVTIIINIAIAIGGATIIYQGVIGTDEESQENFFHGFVVVFGSLLKGGLEIWLFKEICGVIKLGNGLALKNWRRFRLGIHIATVAAVPMALFVAIIRRQLDLDALLSSFGLIVVYVGAVIYQFGELVTVHYFQKQLN